MRCRKCHAELPDNARFCLRCGCKQGIEKKPRIRGNGLGSVYQLPNKTWIAVRTLGYYADEAGKAHRITRSKAGFKTKREAVEYLPLLAGNPTPQPATFLELYKKWKPTHRAGKSTMNCYQAAFQHFAPVWYMKLPDITVDDLQACLDECGKGKRTRQNMKAVCGLLYKYAIPRHLAKLNLGPYLIVGEGETSSKVGLPLEALDKLRGVGDYVLCHCYLGFRPSEFLELDVKDYNRKERAFTGGAKTEAGKNRVVTVSPKIQPIIDRLVADKISGPVFCDENGGKLSIEAYRRLFYDTLERAGIDNPIIEKDGLKRHLYTPHSCRHTFASMMKNIQAADKDKLELIGHTSPEMLRYYQDVSLNDLRRITDAL